MRTSELAKLFGVHPNTIRLYEEWGYLPPIPRDDSGQRVFTDAHVEQLRLARCALHDAPRAGPQLKDSYKELVWLASAGSLQLAITQARKQLMLVNTARERAQHALAFLRGELPEPIAQAVHSPLSIHQAALFIDVSIPVLRRWEFYGLIQVRRSPKNNYRMYGENELGWLLVIRSLRQAGMKVAACKSLLTSYQVLNDVPKSESRTSDPLCDAVAGCISLFSEHQTHTNTILDQLQRMTLQ
jgi:DNA-binding transcriptional MerR regulator